ncbi:hypothetical protein VNO77_08401 [Canavalia gladiata]|uniref:Uncharacterized protein n=1 Tax=Canavalia gladiata TaxID=3824 RepID=A0AAN9M971_CANGL
MLRYGLTGGLSVQHIQLHQSDISQTYWFCYLDGKEGTQGLTEIDESLEQNRGLIRNKENSNWSLGLTLNGMNKIGYRKLEKPCELGKVGTDTAFGPSLAMLSSSYGKLL